MSSTNGAESNLRWSWWEAVRQVCELLEANGETLRVLVRERDAMEMILRLDSIRAFIDELLDNPDGARAVLGALGEL